jgi:dihydrofolate reductase
MAPATPVVLYLACSLDGFIAAPDGSVGWLEAFSRDGEDYGYAGFLAGVGALVMGSRTYEQVLGFGEWPYADLPCFVATSRTLSAPTRADIRFRSGDDLEALAAEARTAAGDRAVWLVGGAALARSMLDAGLVDTLDLALMPVLLGDGVPLFVSGLQPHGLVLRESRTHADGVVQLRYSVQRAG